MIFRSKPSVHKQVFENLRAMGQYAAGATRGRCVAVLAAHWHLGPHSTIHCCCCCCKSSFCVTFSNIVSQLLSAAHSSVVRLIRCRKTIVYSGTPDSCCCWWWSIFNTKVGINLIRVGCPICSFVLTSSETEDICVQDASIQSSISVLISVFYNLHR